MLDVPKMDDFAISLPQQLGMRFATNPYLSMLHKAWEMFFFRDSIQHGQLSTRLESLFAGFSAGMHFNGTDLPAA